MKSIFFILVFSFSSNVLADYASISCTDVIVEKNKKSEMCSSQEADREICGPLAEGENVDLYFETQSLTNASTNIDEWHIEIRGKVNKSFIEVLSRATGMGFTFTEKASTGYTIYRMNHIGDQEGPEDSDYGYYIGGYMDILKVSLRGRVKSSKSIPCLFSQF